MDINKDLLSIAPAIAAGLGHIPYGAYNGLIKDTNTSAWDGNFGFFSRRRSARKAWIFFGVYTADLIACIAIADAGYFTNAFAYFYSASENIFIQDETLVPLGFPGNFDANLNSQWKVKNYLIHTTSDGLMHFSYDRKFKLEIVSRIWDNGVSIIAPSEGKRPFNFSFKNKCLPVEATINHKDKTYKVSGNYGAIDYTKGYPPRNTTWNWCSFVGSTESGHSIGLNLVKYFNAELENIIWIDGRKIILGESFFNIQQPSKTNPWHMGAKDNSLKFTLTPYGARSADINLLFLKSKFVQPFGRMEGQVSIDGIIENFIAYGVTEDHLALW